MLAAASQTLPKRVNSSCIEVPRINDIPYAKGISPILWSLRVQWLGRCPVWLFSRPNFANSILSMELTFRSFGNWMSLIHSFRNGDSMYE